MICAAYFWAVATIAMPSRTSTPDGAEDGLAKRYEYVLRIRGLTAISLEQIPTKTTCDVNRADWGVRVVGSYANYLLYARYLVVEIL